MTPIAGTHHVSAVTAHIQRTHAFYTGVLGLRTVAKSVNQDDPSMYHLFYGDGAGSPGSDITMFDIPGAVRERRGNNSITRTTFRVAGRGALEYWSDRLSGHEVAHGRIGTRDGRECLDFEDPEGTQLSLVDDAGAGAPHPWSGSPVPPEHQVRGLGYPVITVPDLAPTNRFLSEAFGLRRERRYATPGAEAFDTHVFVAGDGGVHAEVHVIVRDDVPRARHGAGGVHHVALRVPAQADMPDWVAHLDGLGYGNSGIVDRHWFTSIYVREPNGVLFELATDEPGFDVDGVLDGERLALPPFLEPRRAEIEAKLKPLEAE